MNHVMREMTGIILVLICAGFFMVNLLGKNDNGIFSVFDSISSLSEEMQKEEAINHTAGMIQKMEHIPHVTYTKGAQYKGSGIKFKEMFEVTLPSGTAGGESTAGFALFLKDIRDGSGKSRLLFLDSEAIASMEEIPADFIYDREKDLLYIHGSGIYYIEIKVYTEDGSAVTYELALPVEERVGV